MYVIVKEFHVVPLRKALSYENKLALAQNTLTTSHCEARSIVLHFISCFIQLKGTNYLDDLDVDGRVINLLMGLRELKYDSVAQDKDMCRASVKKVINLTSCVFHCVHDISKIKKILIQTTMNIQFP
jgi:hypothetical protein